MSLQTLAHRVVELCNQLKNFDVMHTCYHPDIVSVEPTGKQTVGKTPVIQKSERWAASLTIHSESVRGPFFCAPDQFATQTTFEITRHGSTHRETLNEITVYTVKNDLITREQFYFDGQTW